MKANDSIPHIDAQWFAGEGEGDVGPVLTPGCDEVGWFYRNGHDGLLVVAGEREPPQVFRDRLRACPVRLGEAQAEPCVGDPQAEIPMQELLEVSKAIAHLCLDIGRQVITHPRLTEPSNQDLGNERLRHRVDQLRKDRVAPYGALITVATTFSRVDATVSSTRGALPWGRAIQVLLHK